MWIFVFFDLPTESKQDKKNYVEFRRALRKDGFFMFQYSIYLRLCASVEEAEMHKNRVKKILPPRGHTVSLSITDKQFGDMEQYFGRLTKAKVESKFQQLDLF